MSLLGRGSFLLMLLIALGASASAQERKGWSPKAVPDVWVDTILRARVLGPYDPPPPPRPKIERADDTEKIDNKEPQEKAPPPDPDTKLRLVGLVQIDEGGIALIEDMDSNSTQKVKIGDKYSKGNFEAINGTLLIYSVDGERREIGLGLTLAGEAVQASSLPSPTSTSTSAAGGKSSSGGNDDDARRAELLRLMRERRASE